jgi:hypothetical protein
MPIRVRKHKRHKFSLIEELYTPVRGYKPIPRESYPAIGFSYEMTYEEALEQAKRLNKLKLKETRSKAAAARRVADEKLVHDLYLPARWLAEFEEEIIPEMALGNEPRQVRLRKHWSTCKRALMDLELEPREFESRKRAFYNWFIKKKYSPDYTGKLVSLINAWGEFYSSKTQTYFKKLPRPKGDVTQKILEAQETKKSAKRKALPLTASLLMSKRSTFEIAGLKPQWNFLFIELWFACRPIEVGNFENEEHWYIEHNKELGCDVMWIYQTKLQGIPKKERWKPVPILYDEQREALEMIKTKQYKRPHSKTVVAYFGDGYGLYSPRNAALDHFMGLGFAIEDASIIMGHRSVDVSWKHYKDKAHFKLPTKPKVG